MSETTNFASGAVRSADVSHFDFMSLPLIGILGLGKTGAEGAIKYGRYNYMLGMPLHDLLNHSVHHIIMFGLGDRTEPHLEHAAWGLLVAAQSNLLDPEVSAPHMLGPGATLTQANRDHLDASKDDRSFRRQAGEFDELGHWSLADLPDVQTILEQRSEEEDEEDEEGKETWAQTVQQSIANYIRERAICTAENHKRAQQWLSAHYWIKERADTQADGQAWVRRTNVQRTNDEILGKMHQPFEGEGI